MPRLTQALVTSLLPLCTAQEPTALSRDLAEVAAAYAAKVTASAIFVSGRTLDSVWAEELAPTRPLEALIRPFLRFEVDQEGASVTCRLANACAVATATRNLGCTLVRPDTPIATLRQRGGARLADLQPDPSTIDWPLGDRVANAEPLGIDQKAVQRAFDAAFLESPTGTKIHTRAIVVLHRGLLVGEHYAAGYHAAMPLAGWSMTKTLTHALLGVAVQRGRLTEAIELPIKEWAVDDERRHIGLRDLLTMSGGLQWNEDYADPKSDALRMLFGSSDHAGVYAAQPRQQAPGQSFVYASGATNLLCRVMRTAFASDLEYWAFPHHSLFAPLGMRRAVLETDPSGTFVGSSYGFATARDWARLGLLYQNDGVNGSTRVLPPGWVASATTSQPASNGRYGRHLWLDQDPDGDGPKTREWPELPVDLFYMSGHEGQYCVVMPSEQLVIVRLGCTKNGGFDLRGLLGAVHAAVRK